MKLFFLGYTHLVLDELIENNVLSCGDFCWMSRLRYYWRDNVTMSSGGPQDPDSQVTVSSVELQMLYSKVNYGYEYLHAYTRCGH